ncbi:MAG: hypothetical protein Kow00121_12630 [Elainellaceae cyanobacterium]
MISIMATVKVIKTPLWGFLSIALIFAPVFAQNSASATQPPGQSMTQAGNENFVMQGNVQVGIEMMNELAPLL